MKCRDGTNGHLWQIQDETYEWAYSNTKGDYYTGNIILNLACPRCPATKTKKVYVGGVSE